ncbi:MAG: preprotein translocase subunit YajC [Planctomycetaceae bacterium]|jgi:preprotein translocase subunit YajC|nr:preprotein translocase subunit YajC [Planctomycetaceae bacterium]
MSAHDMTTMLPTLLAQGPAAAGEAAAPSAGTTLAPAANGAPAGAAPAQPQGIDFFTIMLFAVLLAFIVMTVLGGRRERKKFEQMLSSIKKNDQVRTVGGIIGSVVEVKPDVIVLKVDETSNTKITVARGKIEAVMKESPAAAN